MTTNDIDAIEARANAATPGPWEFHAGDDYYVTSPAYPTEWPRPRFASDDLGAFICDIGNRPGDFGEANCNFIAATRQDVPALCAEVRELRAALERARALVARLNFALKRIVDNGWIDEAPSSIYDEAKRALKESQE